MLRPRYKLKHHLVRCRREGHPVSQNRGRVPVSVAMSEDTAKHSGGSSSDVETDSDAVFFNPTDGERCV
jgi:hypothetical protein